MAETFSKFSVAKSKGSKIVITKEVLNKIDAIPDKQRHCFPEWHDEVILKYAEIKPYYKIAELLGRSESAIRARYNKLKNEKV